MSFNFPNAPIEGQTYTPVGGYQYLYTDGKWRIVESPQVRATAETRNRIVNGAMQISQENGNTGLNIAGYPADQWQVFSSTTGLVQLQRVQVTTANGSKDRIRMFVQTADATLTTTEQACVFQPIEGGRIADFRYGSASAKQSILRFGWKSPAGTYSVAIRNSANNRSYVANFTISAGQANTDTEQVLVIPGDATGTWLTDTGIGLLIAFVIAAGPTYVGVSGWQTGLILATSTNTNGMTPINSTYEIYDVGLYLDPDATGLPPKWAMPDEAQELEACQRYWQRMYFWVPAGATLYTNTLTKQTRINAAVTGGGAGFSVTLGGDSTLTFWQTTAGTQLLTFSARM